MNKDKITNLIPHQKAKIKKTLKKKKRQMKTTLVQTKINHYHLKSKRIYLIMTKLKKNKMKIVKKMDSLI